jgi:hypothetical protein
VLGDVNIGKVIHIAKYADALLLLAKAEKYSTARDISGKN